MTVSKVKQELKKAANPEKAIILSRFFKTGVGQYGEGDKFLGVVVPAQRIVAKKFKDLPLAEVDQLLQSPYHEHRLTALLILVEQFKNAAEAEQAKLVKFYLAKTKFINNWDLVDLSTPKILGEWLVAHPDSKLLEKLADSKNLWERRIAVLACFAFIRRGELKQIFYLAEKLMDDKHDLMHKAIGWMLREAGKRDEKALRKFLDKYCCKMPRTMLRYAIEKFGEEERRKFLNSK
jgi:3-methyladenine DNA glycosylase AlkD